MLVTVLFIIYLKNLKYLLHPMQKKPPYITNNYIIKSLKNYKFYGQAIGIFSSLLTEAYLQGKKVISIQPKKNKEDKWILSKLYNENYVDSYTKLIAKLSEKNINNKRLFYEMKDSKTRLFNLIVKESNTYIKTSHLYKNTFR